MCRPTWCIVCRGLSSVILFLYRCIAGGFPFAAFAVTPAVNAQLFKGDHGGTYCGNPLGCAASLAVVDYLIEEDVAARVTVAGQQLLGGLRQLQRAYPSLIREVRGRGLLCALELPGDAEVQAVTQACLDLGLIVTPTRNRVVRLIPYLLVTSAEIEEGLRRLDAALSRVVHYL